MEVLEVSYLDQTVLDMYGYAKFERTEAPANMKATATSEYFMDVDGIVRDRLILTPFTQDEILTNLIRTPRANLLYLSDWTQISDNNLTEEQRQEWALYREELRQMTTVFADAQTAADITWPVAPN
jgi:hypothetical protein